MEKTKKILNRIFIDGLSGMALGLFSTLIIGTIIAQIGTLIGGPIMARVSHENLVQIYAVGATRAFFTFPWNWWRAAAWMP